MKAFFLIALLISCGCEKSQLVEIEVISVHERIDKGWYTRFSHTIVERTDTRERGFIFSSTIGKTGDVFKVWSNRIRW